MTTITPLSYVETTHIGENVVFSPFCVVKSNVTIGNHVIIHPHVVIESGVIIGDYVEIFPGAYLGKEPKGAGAIARQSEFDKKIVIGDYCSIGPHSTLYYDVTIGQHTLIGDNASIREKVTIGEYCIISRGVTINYNTRVGNRTKIMDLSHITGNCEIGDDVFISVLVATTNDRAIGRLEYDENRVQGPIIGNQVSIGAQANILPNVTIGEGAIVAAASVVSKDVPAGKMVVGSTARVIKDISTGGGGVFHELALVETDSIGEGTRIWANTHILAGARIGKDCNICDHTFIENDVIIGDRVTIKSGVYIWDGIRIEDDVFIGPSVTFTNDLYPRSKHYPEKFLETWIKKGASIGANATVLPGLTIGERAMVGAGAVVTKSVPADAVVVGNPARVLEFFNS